jgi:hypothetical protein
MTKSNVLGLLIAVLLPIIMGILASRLVGWAAGIPLPKPANPPNGYLPA